MISPVGPSIFMHGFQRGFEIKLKLLSHEKQQKETQ